MKKTKIIFVTQTTNSGNDVFYKYLYEGLSSIGRFECSLLTISTKLQFAPWFSSVLVSKSSFETTDIVITNLETASILPSIASPILGIAHHDPGNKNLLKCLPFQKRLYYKHWLGKQFRAGIPACKRIVTVSKATQSEILTLIPPSQRSKLLTIVNAIDTKDYFPSSFPSRQGTPFRLLFVGNSSNRKGFDLLPKIMTILGKDFELRYTTGLRSKRSHKHFGPRNMTPLSRLSQEDLLLEYQNCDALLFPSRSEGFGYSAVEAMACGKPIIGVKCSTLPEIVPESTHIFLAGSHNPQEIASKTRLCRNTTTDSKELELWVKENYSLSRMKREYEQLILEVLNEGLGN